MNCKQCGAPIPSTTPGAKCFYCGKDPTVGASSPGSPTAPTAAAGRPGAVAGSSGAGRKILPLFVVLMVGSVVAWFLVSESPDAEVEEPAVAPQAVAVVTAPDEPAAKPSPPQWKGDKLLVCAGDERHRLKGATIEGRGGLIRASGKCQVTLDSCTIVGRSIDVQEEAQLTIVGGRLEDTLVTARGQARLTLNTVELERKSYPLRLVDQAEASVERGKVTTQYSPAVRVDDEARLFLRQVAVTGGVEARGESVIYVGKGSLSLPESSESADLMESMESQQAAAVTLYDAAIVALETVTVTGPIKKHGGEVIELQPGDDAEAIIKATAARAARLQRYERNGCQGFIGCFTDHGSSGKVDVHVVMPIGPEGKVVGARVKRALGANPKTRACLQKTASERVIDSFEGPPGALECKFGGMIQGGTQMLSFAIDYIPKDKPKPPTPR